FRSIPAFVEDKRAAAADHALRKKQAGITVLSPGLLSSVQDGGRHAGGAIGVGRAGAMDDISLRLANMLVGNAQDAAALEITLRGPRLRFAADTLIAITGAEIDARCGNESVPLWHPVLLRAGSELNLGGMRRGTRAYLALAGGIDLPAVIGSCSTDINAALGPITRPLVAGDELSCIAAPPSACGGLWKALEAVAKAENRNAVATAWSLDPSPWFDVSATRPIRAIVGTHFEHLDAESQRLLFGGEFRIGIDSNRVGCRLESASMRLATPIEMVSAGTAPGTVQLPPGGVPIALTAEAPTTGGYPRIAQVIAIDMPHLAQRRPGDAVRFAQTDLADAQMRYLERERALAKLESWIRARLLGPW
ncbi:biotin-dependent carboxyltransferase family protein, partial [Rudaea sp.]|uniref:5-oxoprolinase subunit C family protein n=1 Tax=Rudaea sp. TaxID=2136325 RepID=UPI002ED3F6C6